MSKSPDKNLYAKTRTTVTGFPAVYHRNKNSSLAHNNSFEVAARPVKRTGVGAYTLRIRFGTHSLIVQAPAHRRTKSRTYTHPVHNQARHEQGTVHALRIFVGARA